MRLEIGFISGLFVSLFCVSSIFADCPQLIAASDVPCNITSSGNYTISQDVFVSSGDGISVEVGDVSIDGAGHTLNYCASGYGDAIDIDRDVDNIEISNLTITKGNFQPGSGQSCHGLRHNGGFSGWSIHDNTFNLSTTAVANAGAAKAMALAYIDGGSNNVIASNVLNVSGVSGGYGIFISTKDDGSPLWTGSIQGNVIKMDMVDESKGRNYGISIEGPSNSARIEQNSLETVVGATGRTQSLYLRKSRRWEVLNNSFKLRTKGSRGVLLDYSDNNIISHNVIDMPTISGTGNSAAIRIRYGSDFNRINNNTISSTVGDGEAIGIRLGGASSSAGIGLTNRPLGNVFENNDIKTTFRSVSIEEGEDAVFNNNSIYGLGDGYAVFVQAKNSTEITENLMFSNGIIVAERSEVVRFLYDFKDVQFCGNNITDDDIQIALADISEYSIDAVCSNSNSDSPPKPPSPISITIE